MSDFDTSTGFDLEPDSDIAVSLPEGIYGVDGEAELVSITGKTHTFKEGSKKAGQHLRWVDFAVAIDSPQGKVFVHSTPWVDAFNTVNDKPAPGRAPSKVIPWLKALGLYPAQFAAQPDEKGNHEIIAPVDGTKVLVTTRNRTYTDKDNNERVDTYIAGIERRP